MAGPSFLMSGLKKTGNLALNNPISDGVGSGLNKAKEAGASVSNSALGAVGAKKDEKPAEGEEGKTEEKKEDEGFFGKVGGFGKGLTSNIPGMGKKEDEKKEGEEGKEDKKEEDGFFGKIGGFGKGLTSNIPGMGKKEEEKKEEAKVEAPEEKKAE